MVSEGALGLDAGCVLLLVYNRVKSKGPLQSIQLARNCKLEGDWTARVETSFMWSPVRKTDNNTGDRDCCWTALSITWTLSVRYVVHPCGADFLQKHLCSKSKREKDDKPI